MATETCTYCIYSISVHIKIALKVVLKWRPDDQRDKREIGGNTGNHRMEQFFVALETTLTKFCVRVLETLKCIVS